MSTQQIYDKRALSITEQLNVLKAGKLLIADEKAALKFLSEVSYFRFVQYLLPMEKKEKNTKEIHDFKPNSWFENAVGLYAFDTSLRSLMFKTIQRIEIALRTKIVHEFSMLHHPFWFNDENLARDKKHFERNIEDIERYVESSREEFILEHRARYDEPNLPPAWKTLEVVTLGSLSKLYYNFTDVKAKKQVARAFNLPQHEVLESWIRSLTEVRNICAHHTRLWNKKLASTPQMKIKKLRGKWVNDVGKEKKIYAVICCIAYWLDAIGGGEDFKKELKSLIACYPQVDVEAMGFSVNWKNEALWITI